MKEITFDTPVSSFADYAPLPLEDGVEPIESSGAEAPHIPVGLSDYYMNEAGRLVLAESSRTLARELYYAHRVAYSAEDSRRSVGRYNADGTVTELAVQYTLNTAGE
jgi:hypothetical protein